MSPLSLPVRRRVLWLCLLAVLCTLTVTTNPLTYARAIAAHAHTSSDEKRRHRCGHEHIAANVANEPMTYISFGKKKTTSSTTPSSTTTTAATKTTSDGIVYVDKTPQRNVTGAAGMMQPRIIEVLNSGSASSSSAASEWAPIRIAVFTPDLEDDTRYCTEVGQSRPDYEGHSINCDTTGDLLTEAKRQTLINFVLPQAVKAHTARLMVRPLAADATIKVGVNNNRYCRSFTIPESHKTDGVPDADFVVYVAAGPTSTPSGLLAWALTCQWYPVDLYHAAVGIIYFNPRYLPESVDETVESIEVYGGDPFGSTDYLRRTAAHELTHALGFSANVFNGLGMLQRVPSLRGKSNVPVLNGTALRAAAKAHYGISDSDLFYGLELEDQGGSGTSISHWKRRSTKDEMMSPVLNQARYSALTLAVLEDLGYYKPIYANAEPLGYGYKSGVAMFNEQCVVDVSPSVPGVFCATTSSAYHACTVDRLKIGRCYLTTYSSDLPSYEQYFSDRPAYGGALPYMDYCPVYQPLSNADCNSGRLSVIPGSVTSAASRCFDGNNLVVKSTYTTVYAICAQVHCDNATGTYEVLVNGASTWLSCGPGGDGYRVRPATASSSVYVSTGTLSCPRYEEVCYANPAAFEPVPETTTTTTTTTTASPSAALRLSSGVGSVVVVVAVLLAIVTSMTGY